MTPEEIRARALECAAVVWGPQGITSYKHVLTTAMEFEDYIVGPSKPMPAPLIDRLPQAPLKEQPREHTDHDGNLWGPLCAACGHSRGNHSYEGNGSGCHIDVAVDPSTGHVYCECEQFTLVRPAAVQPGPPKALCTCHKHKHVVGSVSGTCLHLDCYCRSVQEKS